MTADEFNEKWKAHLEKGHYGCDLHRPEAIEYLDKEFEKLAIDQTFTFSQIKSKFGSFRLHCTGVSLQKVNEIEDELYNIYSKQ